MAEPIRIGIAGGRVWHYRGKWLGNCYGTLCGHRYTRTDWMPRSPWKATPDCAACVKAAAAVPSEGEK